MGATSTTENKTPEAGSVSRNSGCVLNTLIVYISRRGPVEAEDPTTIQFIIFDIQEILDEVIKEVQEIWDQTSTVCRFFRQLECRGEVRALLPMKWQRETELQELYLAKHHPDHIC